MSNINSFPIDQHLKDQVANTVISQMERIGFERTENTVRWFSDECSQELVENILEAIDQWTTAKLQ